MLQKIVVSKLHSLFRNLSVRTKRISNELQQYKYFLDFEERNNDIYIAAFPKSGTTWMQIILYNLLHSIDLDFDHIYDVSPWIRNEAFLNLSAKRVNDLPSPRIIKTHDDYSLFSKDVKGRFVFVYRDGRDVALSLYHHNKSYRDPDLTFEKNYETHFANMDMKVNWFNYTKEWLINNNELNILYISYYDLKNNFELTLNRLAEFLKVEVGKEKIAEIKRSTSFENMKKHQEKFGEKPTKSSRLVFNQFIREGKSGEGKKEMSKEQLMDFDIKYRKNVMPYESALSSGVELLS